MRLIFTAIFLVTCLLGTTVTAGISISQSVDRDEIAFTDTVTFKVILTWDGPQFAYRFDRPLDPQFTSLKVVGFTSAISSDGIGDDEITTKRFSYRLIPTLSGIGRIDPIMIGYVEVSDSLAGELQTDETTIRIAKPVAKDESTSSLLWLYLLIPALLIGGGATGFLLKRRAKSRQTPVLTPKEVFLAKLTEIKRESGNDMKQFQYQLYDALTEFTKLYCSVDPDGMDEETVKSALASSKLSELASSNIAKWLAWAERDKYQPIQSAPGDTIRLESEIRTLFEKLD